MKRVNINGFVVTINELNAIIQLSTDVLRPYGIDTEIDFCIDDAFLKAVRLSDDTYWLETVFVNNNRSLIDKLTSVLNQGTVNTC